MKFKKGIFERASNIYKSQSDRLGKNERKHKLPSIRNEKCVITVDSVHIRRILGKYYKQLYVNKLDNLDEWENSLKDANNLEDIILSEISQIKTNIVWYHLYVETLKKKRDGGRKKK